MSGWRVGYMAGPQEFIDQAIKIAQLNYVCAPTPFQWAGVKALSFNMSEQIGDYKKKRDLVYDGLVEAGYEVVFPNGAFYFFVKYPYNAEKFLHRCLDNKLLVVPGNGFSAENTHFRISFCQEDDVLKKALIVLASVLIIN